MMRVKLADIIDAMQFQIEGMSSYLNKRTGEVVTVNDDDLEEDEDRDLDLEDQADWAREDRELAADIRDSDDYLALPDRFEIDEYNLMERFSLEVDDDPRRPARRDPRPRRVRPLQADRRAPRHRRAVVPLP